MSVNNYELDQQILMSTDFIRKFFVRKWFSNLNVKIYTSKKTELWWDKERMSRVPNYGLKNKTLFFVLTFEYRQRARPVRTPSLRSHFFLGYVSVFFQIWTQHYLVLDLLSLNWFLSVYLFQHFISMLCFTNKKATNIGFH